METATQLVQQAPEVRVWSPAARVSFRFCFLYLGLYCLLTQIFLGLVPIPAIPFDDLGSLWPVRPMVYWTEVHVFRLAQPIPVTETGAGDRMFDWSLVFCLLVISVAATLAWSIADRKRPNYLGLGKWFRIALRFCLAGQMFAYGLDKVFVLQMPFPFLTRLVEPYGNFSPMGVLWSSIGASPGYEVFAGLAEFAGGLLLILPRTTTLGALVCLADMIQVFMLNMSYDVPVKLLSFHLILVSLFLLAPDAKRLINFFVLNGTVEPAKEPGLFASRRRNRIALVVQVLFGIWLLATNLNIVRGFLKQYGAGREVSPLYGIWNIESETIDGKVRDLNVTDSKGIRRVIFDFPAAVTFQQMDESFVGHRAAIDMNRRTIVLTDNRDKNWKANFGFQRPAPNQMTLDGNMDGHGIQMQLKLMDRNQLMLVSRGFHWVQEAPFNR